MDLTRRLNSTLVALDDRNRVLGYFNGEDARAFLAEILQGGPQRWGPQGWRSVTIHHVCPYVLADRDKWYAENAPVLRYAPVESTHGAGPQSPAQAIT
ncbi:MAG TPA: hypothetical protein VND94_21220 [Terriglobia bacterium]|nr:hypothetical protein [Terriglobia bacterium]